MTTDLPSPLVPAEVDLRGLEHMPLKGDVLFSSSTWLKGSHEARCAALRLWWHSFAHEVPAASLPNDDQLLAQHAGYGEIVKAWVKIKPQAMRGWVLCNDGRWYHRIVAELALTAWGYRVRNRNKVRNWRERMSGGNQQSNGSDTSTEPVTEPGTGLVTARRVDRRVKRVEKKEEELLPKSDSLPARARSDRDDPGIEQFIPEGPDAPDPATVKPFLRRHLTQQAIPPNWRPSSTALQRVRAARPDMTETQIAEETERFLSWCAETNKTTFSPEDTWLNFMRKSHVKPASEDDPDDSPLTRGINAAFARRFPDG